MPLFMVQIWHFPDRLLENAIRVPSGDYPMSLSELRVAAIGRRAAR